MKEGPIYHPQPREGGDPFHKMPSRNEYVYVIDLH